MAKRGKGGPEGRRVESVTIYRTTDPMRAQVLTEFLEQQGVPARHLGTRHGAAIGVGQHILKQRVEVPADRADEAREIVADFEAAHGEEPQTDEADRQLRKRYRGKDGGQSEGAAADRSRPSTPARLRPMLAAGIVPVVPGGGHFYARNPWIGLAIVLGWLVSLAVGAFISPAGPFTGLTLVLLLAYDLVDAQVAVRNHNAGMRRSRGLQLLLGFGALSLILALGVLAAFLEDR